MTQLYPDAHGKGLEGYDSTQIEFMKEMCIQVDESDRTIGQVSKKEAHLMTNIEKGLLHRAFSVFIFNNEGKLLLQQRAAEKITFPNRFTNTCCSHPLSIPDELIEDDNATGVKNACVRKLEQELGIKKENLDIRKFEYLTRIHYQAPCSDVWGEHEIDYIMFYRGDVGEVVPNPNEVRSYTYVSKAELYEMLNTADEKGIQITPWFRLIAQSLLPEWWDNLDNLSRYVDHTTIHRLG